MCYLIQNGADRFSFIFFRGFGTGAMHVLCGLIVGGGLAYTWQRTWLKIAGTVSYTHLDVDKRQEVKGKDPVQIGSYRGFTMSVAFDSMWKTYTLSLHDALPI